MTLAGNRLTRSLPLILLIAWVLAVAAPGFVCAAPKPDGPSVQEAQNGTQLSKDEPAQARPSPDVETPVPLRTEQLDEAGKMLGKKIDQVGIGASLKLGRWINAKAFWGITWLKLFVCFGLLLLVIVVDRLVRNLISARLAPRRAGDKEEGWFVLVLGALSQPLSLFIRVYGIYWALSPLLGYFDTGATHNLMHRSAGKMADVGGTAAIFWFAYRMIEVVDCRLRRWANSTQSAINDMLAPLVAKALRIFTIVVGGIMVVQNLTGIEVAPLVASLGIGGLAFALAGKDSIANFFGSLTILLDKPFQVGERVVIDNHDGFVEDVGFRSTRLRTLTGNMVSIPNEKIINSTLENIGRRSHLRWHTNIGITCDTPPEKVERAVLIVRDILENHEGMREDFQPRVHFNGFNDWNLNIAVYAWYHPADYWSYQAWLQRTCLEIMRRYRDEGIEFAFPTQTVYQMNPAGPGNAEPVAHLHTVKYPK